MYQQVIPLCNSKFNLESQGRELGLPNLQLTLIQEILKT